MEARVTHLEEEVADVKAILRRLEPMIIRVDAAIPYLATKADIAELRLEMREGDAALRAEMREGDAALRAEMREGDASLRAEIAEIRISLADKPSRAYMWGIITAMVAAFACGLAGLAILK